MYLVSAQQMRQMDENTIHTFGLPGRVLMENAARGAVAALDKHFPAICNQHVGVMAGSGNNAGDGFVMARLLAARGISVTVFMLAPSGRIKGDAADNLALLPAMAVPLLFVGSEDDFETHRGIMQQVDLWIDAIFGTGLNAPVRGIYRNAIALINASNRPVLAVDIPSGLCADNGRVLGVAVQATVTATFAFAKLGHYLLPGTEYSGELEIVDIGIPPHIVARQPPSHFVLTPQVAARGQRARALNAHKGTSGHLLVLAGSAGKSGAAVLTTQAALRTGAGLVTLALPSALYPIVASQLLEAMTLPLPEVADGLDPGALEVLLGQMEGKQVMAMGPGLGTTSRIGALVRGLIEQAHIPLVLDADALNVLAGHLDVLRVTRAPVVITPHPGEMARLLLQSTATINDDRIGAAKQLATEYRIVVVLKGARTIVAASDGRVWINPIGNPGMASGGMGDALTGIIAALIAQGATPLQAARRGVYLHARAADELAATIGPYGYLASDLITRLPGVLQSERCKAP